MKKKQTFRRLLEHIPADTTEIWLFEPLSERRRMERVWQQRGHSIRIHSAYKTLLHDILEEGLLNKAKEAIIRYPQVAGDDPLRFRLECYPLTDLLCCDLRFTAMPCKPEPLPWYEIIVDGKLSYKVPVPVRWRRRSWGERVLAACAWRINDQGEGQPIVSEFERIYASVCRRLWQMPIKPLRAEEPNGPFFQRLEIEIGLPAEDMPLPVGEEHISFSEALHEDLYFSALEIFQQRTGLPPGSREVTPGQLLPMIKAAPGPCLTLRESGGEAAADTLGGCPELSSIGHWLTPPQINAHLEQLGAVRFSALSRQKRPIWGLYHRGQSTAMLAISGGQHANESSGIVGALRAGAFLQTETALSFTLCPLENPDGYAAFRRLCKDNPRHMHHAARYTAAGSDLSCGVSPEQQIRRKAIELLPARVHLNMHGYPAHEWTRPLSGYIPKGFATWTLPKGYFLICRYRKDEENLARQVMQAAIDAIKGHNAQMQQNRQMLTRYLHMVETPGFAIAEECIPWQMEQSEGLYPVEIITEAPDETTYGESFRIAHESHLRVAIAIARLLESLCYN